MFANHKANDNGIKIKPHFARIIEKSRQAEIRRLQRVLCKISYPCTDRNAVLNDLAAVCQKFALKNSAILTYFDKEQLGSVDEGTKILNKHFPKELLAIYDKELPATQKKSERECQNNYVKQNNKVNGGEVELHKSNY